jgi:hypothetical protein
MKVLYNGWEEWIVSKGKEIRVGDGSRKTFHYVMDSWYDKETPEAKEKIDESEDVDTFGNDGGYSSDRARSRHSGTWKTGQLRDQTMKGGKRGENQNGSDESSGNEEEERTYPKTPDNSDPSLFSVPAAASSGRPQEIPGWLLGKGRRQRRSIKREGRCRDDNSVCFSG